MAITDEVKSASFLLSMICLIVLCIVQAINDALYQILSTSKFAQMIEGSKNIVFIQKAEMHPSTARSPKV